MAVATYSTYCVYIQASCYRYVFVFTLYVYLFAPAWFCYAFMHAHTRLLHAYLLPTVGTTSVVKIATTSTEGKGIEKQYPFLCYAFSVA